MGRRPQYLINWNLPSEWNPKPSLNTSRLTSRPNREKQTARRSWSTYLCSRQGHRKNFWYSWPLSRRLSRAKVWLLVQKNMKFLRTSSQDNPFKSLGRNPKPTKMIPRRTKSWLYRSRKPTSFHPRHYRIKIDTLPRACLIPGLQRYGSSSVV